MKDVMAIYFLRLPQQGLRVVALHHHLCQSRLDQGENSGFSQSFIIIPLRSIHIPDLNALQYSMDNEAQNQIINIFQSPTIFIYLCSGTFWIQFEMCEEIGEGAFGKAVKARRRKVGSIFESLCA